MSDTKHGWVTPRADGARARCGGPGVCATCDTEAMHEAMLTGVFGVVPLPAAPGSTSSAPGNAQDELTRDRIEEIAREVYKVERFTKDDEVWHNLHWLTSFAKAIEKELRRAPAAGDALDLMKTANILLDGIEQYQFECQAGPLELCVHWQALRDLMRGEQVAAALLDPVGHAARCAAALAAQVPQQGEA